MVVASARACIDSQGWLQAGPDRALIPFFGGFQSGMQSETGFKSPNEQPSVVCCSRTLMDRRLKPSGEVALKCPRCDSTNTKFCYYNNYSLTQPRYFCKACRRYWTKGGSLRNVPVGGGCRKNKRSSKRSSADQIPGFSSLRLNEPSVNSTNSSSKNHSNDELTDDGSPNNLNRQNSILPVYFSVGLNGGDGLGVAYAAAQHQHQHHQPTGVTEPSGLASNNDCTENSTGMLGNGRYIQHESGGPVLQSGRPPLLNLSALLAGLESPHRTAADQGAALMSISGDLGSILELTRQNQAHQVATSSARPISQLRDRNAFNEAFNLVAVPDNGLNNVEWLQQQQQKQPVSSLEDDNRQIDVMLPFDHRRRHHHNAMEEFRIPADPRRTLRQLAVTTTTMQQPSASNKIYEDNRPAPYNCQAPNLSESLILNESPAALNTGYWNMGESWPDLSYLDFINTEFSS